LRRAEQLMIERDQRNQVFEGKKPLFTNSVTKNQNSVESRWTSKD
jgi:hypothetical protein